MSRFLYNFLQIKFSPEPNPSYRLRIKEPITEKGQREERGERRDFIEVRLTGNRES